MPSETDGFDAEPSGPGAGSRGDGVLRLHHHLAQTRVNSMTGFHHIHQIKDFSDFIHQPCFWGSFMLQLYHVGSLHRRPSTWTAV